ncbi:MAG: biotin--[Clostridia bacterium]|nr:biotin--[acetyl-CoA-carboxylase] ligase [Clostridia bacterium]
MKKNKLNFSSALIKKISAASDVIILDTVSSTNTYMKENVTELKDKTVVLAYHQTSGRGRCGKTFYSEAHGGLYMSILLENDSISSANIQILTICAAVAVCRGIKKVCNIAVDVKWVNDIIYQNRKICGILCEKVNGKNEISSGSYIVGIGININNADFPQEIKTIAGSILCKAGDENFLASHIAEELFCIVNEDINEVIAEYRSLIGIMIGKKVKFSLNGAKFSGIATGINNVGNLIVNSDGKEYILSSGEVTLKTSNIINN